MKKAIKIILAAVILAAAVFGFVLWRAREEASAAIDACNAAAEEYNASITAYNEAAAQTAAANEALRDVLETADTALEEGAEAYEPDTLDALREAVGQAGGALVEVPVQIEPFEERSPVQTMHMSELKAQKTEAEAAAAGIRAAKEKIPPVPEVPDYSEQIRNVEEARKAYADSVQKLANVTNPPDSFVAERLRGLETVVQAQAVTADHDPNERLGKEGGYTGCVYFLDSRIDRALLPAEAFPGEDSEKDGESRSDGEEESSEDIVETEGATEAAADMTTGAAAEQSAAGSSAEQGAAGAAAEQSAAGSSAEQSAETEAAAAETPRIDVVLIGTAGGGAVEIYATAEEAEKRDQYLSYFEGSVMDPGAHEVEGTCVIRTSKYLEEKEQKRLAGKIRQALLAVE